MFCLKLPRDPEQDGQHTEALHRGNRWNCVGAVSKFAMATDLRGRVPMEPGRIGLPEVTPCSARDPGVRNACRGCRESRADRPSWRRGRHADAERGARLGSPDRVFPRANSGRRRWRSPKVHSTRARGPRVGLIKRSSRRAWRCRCTRDSPSNGNPESALRHGRCEGGVPAFLEKRQSLGLSTGNERPSAVVVIAAPWGRAPHSDDTVLAVRATLFKVN